MDNNTWQNKMTCHAREKEGEQKKGVERKVREEGGNIQQREKGRMEEGSTNLLQTSWPTYMLIR